jgi:lipoprotein-anchoring transpeptidase ErfK/SrfK
MLTVAAAAVAGGATASATPSERAAVVQAGPKTAIKRLSDLRSSSAWAYPMAEATVRSSPSPHARSLGRLRFLTVDGQAELYVVLASARLGSGKTWLQIEVPGRPNGRTGWVPRGALGQLNRVQSYLKIDEQTLTTTLYRRGQAVFSARVGVGKPGTVTPKGHFYVMEKLRTSNAPAYGPFAIGTSAYAPTLSEWPGGGVVGIHGTNEPQLIPGRPSHGCVRMRDSDVAKLWATIQLGTPIEIV